MARNAPRGTGETKKCPCGRATGKNPQIQWSPTEVIKLEILVERNQEMQVASAGPIKSKARGDVCF